MKKFLSILFIVFLIIGCKQPWGKNDPGETTPPDYSLGFDMVFDIPDLGLKTVEDIMIWTATEIQYVGDQIHDIDEYWQNPYQTYTWRCGDCEDYSILAMYLIYRDTDFIPEMVVGHMNIGSGLHAWVFVNGIEWEPQVGMTIDEVYTEYSIIYTALYTVPYEEAIYRSNTTHKAFRMKE